MFSDDNQIDECYVWWTRLEYTRQSVSRNSNPRYYEILFSCQQRIGTYAIGSNESERSRKVKRLRKMRVRDMLDPTFGPDLLAYFMPLHLQTSSRHDNID